MVVTSRQHSIAEETRRWLDAHFPDTFAQVVFGNHWGQSGVKRSKAELCAELHARVLIDDLVDYAHQCSHVVERVIIFGEYNWNKSAGPSNAHRARDWASALAMLEAHFLCPPLSLTSQSADLCTPSPPPSSSQTEQF